MFNVYRSHEAMTFLRQAWEQGDEALREAIGQASLRIDKLLCADPHEEGESREGPARILFQTPVGVLYEVDADQNLVRVLRSWVYCPVRDKDGLCG